MREPVIVHCVLKPGREAVCNATPVRSTHLISDVTCVGCLTKISDAVVRVHSAPSASSNGMKEDKFDGQELFTFTVKGKVSDQARAVLSMLPAWIDLFVKKNQDYTNSGGQVADNFGIMGQFMKLTDKVHKLRKPLWDQQVIRQAAKLVPTTTNTLKDLNFEDADEILDDIIGHCMLTKLYLKEQDS